MTPLRRRSLLLSVVLLVAACSTTGSTPASPAAPGSSIAELSPALTETPAAATQAPASPVVGTIPSTSADPTAAAPILDQPWATAELTDVATGETFRLADLAGRPVIIETMAIWCTNCLRQQGHVYEALGRLEVGSVEYVLIDVDPNETAAALAEYRERNGFTGRYVVASREVARALADEFGDQVLNPPSTPMVVIGDDGRVTLTPYGQSKSPDEVIDLAEEHGA